MRRAARVDANQQAIVDALRGAGAAVEVIGKPVDLLVAWRGRNLLMECKDGRKYACHRPLTKPQKDFIPNWPGQVVVVLDPAHALEVLGAEKARTGFDHCPDCEGLGFVRTAA